jgi:Flp pilus assembly protein TadB
MGRKGGGGRQQQVRGFRPGREPAQLRKRQAKARLGDDANWAQKKLVDALGDKSPAQVRTMMSRWTTVLLTIATLLAVGGAFLYRWSVIAGVAVHLLTLLVFFLWFQLRRKRAEFEKLAEMLGGGRRR